MSKDKDESLEASAEQQPEAVDEKSKKAPKAKKEPMSMSRRSLLIGGVGTACLLGFGALRYAGHTAVVRPPGGQDEPHLVDACIRCEKCYEACPNGVIYPCHLEDGLLGMRSPAMSFRKSDEKDENGDYKYIYCDFCTEANGGHPRCVETCPTGALVLPEDATWAETKIGLAHIDEYQCLAYRDTACHTCVDVCPQQAIDYYSANATKEKALRPVVNEDKCNGCGYCEAACLSLTTGSVASGATQVAIVVTPDYNRTSSLS